MRQWIICDLCEENVHRDLTVGFEQTWYLPGLGDYTEEVMRVCFACLKVRSREEYDNRQQELAKQIVKEARS